MNIIGCYVRHHTLNCGAIGSASGSVQSKHDLECMLETEKEMAFHSW